MSFPKEIKTIDSRPTNEFESKLSPAISDLSYFLVTIRITLNFNELLHWKMIKTTGNLLRDSIKLRQKKMGFH
jgi:hypothetical protein